jgi:hypothetical protein
MAMTAAEGVAREIYKSVEVTAFAAPVATKTPVFGEAT